MSHGAAWPLHSAAPRGPDHTSRFALERDRPLRAFVHRERKHVGPRVVAHHVEVVTRAHQLVGVDFGRDESRLAAQRPASTSPNGPTITLPPLMSGRSGSQPGTSMPSAAGEGCTWQALTTKQRPSCAMWRIEHCQTSRSSTVGAHHTCTPFAYIAVRSSGMWFSQQIAAAAVPAAVSTTGSVEPSPCAQIRRSVPVGISLRCFATSPAPGSKKSAVQ